MPRTRVSLNSKARQLGWLKTKKYLKNYYRLISTNKLQQLKKFSKKISSIAYYENHLPNLLERNFNKVSSKLVKLQPIKIKNAVLRT